MFTYKIKNGGCQSLRTQSCLSEPGEGKATGQLAEKTTSDCLSLVCAACGAPTPEHGI